MNKIIAAALTTAFLCAPSYAEARKNTSGETFSPLTGFYVGAFGGYGIGNGDYTTTGDPDVNGADYGILAGFKIDALLNETINRVGLGLNGALEAHYGWSDANDSVNGIDFEKDSEWGISFRPGLSILDNVSPFGINPYGIIGYRRADFEASGGGTDFDDAYDGFELGIGTEVIAYENVGVRFDYSHVWYEEQSNFDPSEHDFRVGAVYHF